MPAARQASYLLGRATKIDGSPPFSRTTRRPDRAAATISASIVPWSLEWRPDRLPTPTRSCRTGPGRARPADQRVEEDDVGGRDQPLGLRVSSSGSPGPARPARPNRREIVRLHGWSPPRAGGPGQGGTTAIGAGTDRRADRGDIGKLLVAVSRPGSSSRPGRNRRTAPRRDRRSRPVPAREQGRRGLGLG